ncbi:MAG: hypothetical protein ACTTKH_06660 [Treponema sp.]
MEIADKERLKKIGIVSAIFLVFVIILFSLTFLDFLKQNTLRKIVIEMLTSSPLCDEYSDVHYLEISKKYANLAFPSVFEGKNEKSHFYVFFVRLTGKYGVQTGLFLYDEGKKKTVFCGIIGQDFKKQASYYGFNEGIINYWCKKISLPKT